MRKLTPNTLHKDEDSLGKLMRRMSHLGDNSISNVYLKEKLEGVIVRFQDEECYRNDERYLKLWMRYADLTDDANKVFNFLKSKGIGVQLALFWAAWAYVLEMAESYSGALEVLVEGYTRGATPLSLLKECQGAFHDRMWERMRIARSSPGRCTVENEVLVGSSPRVRDRVDLAAAATSGIVRCLSGSPESVHGRSFDAGLGQRHDETIEADRRTCTDTLKQPPLPGSPAPEQLDRGKDWPTCNQRAPREEGDTEYLSARDTGADGTTRCMPTGGSTKSAGSPPEVREANSAHQTAPRYGGRRTVAGSARSTLSSVSSACGAANLTLIHDPFSVERRKHLTVASAQYQRWANSSSVVYDARPECLAKRWPRKMATVKAGSRKQITLSRVLGEQRMDIIGMLGKGAYAVVFSCKIDGDQRNLAVKIEHEDHTPSLPWECFITLQMCERLQGTCDKRDDSQNKLPIAVVKPEALYLYGDGFAMTMPQGPSGTLHDLVSLYTKRAQTMPQLVVMHYTVEMLRFCRAMHSVSILHMDIKPDNWLLTHRPADELSHTEEERQPRSIAHSISLIDFGRAIDLSMFPHNGSGMAFMGKCCPSRFSCPAMTEGLPWKDDADLFALGSCIYFMLHGVYLEVSTESSTSERFGRRWRPAKQCKRYWEVHIWDDVFNELLNAHCGEAGTAGAEAILDRLEKSLSSHLDSHQRVRELRELLRRQDNMFFDR